ncbi:Cystatin domain [Musa troglodytarum]|uniref:Cysteine proteinase inhibitor n=2 Tax=Musa troglodytarum TaxID=320322 RepID=A0A9E7H8R9_9LILI|nr:Cystatin domain [Musa troglodytarum]
MPPSINVDPDLILTVQVGSGLDSHFVPVIRTLFGIKELSKRTAAAATPPGSDGSGGHYPNPISTAPLGMRRPLPYHPRRAGERVENGGFFRDASFPAVATASDPDATVTVGGISGAEGAPDGAEIEQLARFAVDEHNKKRNTLLEFARVVNAREQVVVGTLHHLTVEVIDAGKKKIYEAKVWIKPWLKLQGAAGIQACQRLLRNLASSESMDPWAYE